MDIIRLSAVFINRQPTNECTFEVSINGGGFRPANGGASGTASVELPPTPRPLPLEIRATPTTNHHFRVEEGRFEYRWNGELVAIRVPKEFMPPRGIRSSGHNSISVVVVLSRVRDRTNDVLASLARVPGSRVGHPPTSWPPSAWDTPSLANPRYIASPPVRAGNLYFDLRTIDPDTEDLVLEVAGVDAPQLIAVSWPRALRRTIDSDPTPFLIYFHPTVGQNVGAGFYEGPDLGSYPFGWDYLFYGLWRYLNYMGDPITVDPYPKGLPYQVAASGKHAVLVLPLNKKRIEVGAFLDAASAEELLREIQAFMFRREGIYEPPELGRTALAAFSDGNPLVARFLGLLINQRHLFYQNILKEVYMFDAPRNSVLNWVAQAIRWARAGDGTDKMIRIYTRNNSPSHSTLLGQSTPAVPLFVASSSNGLRTAAVLPMAAWRSTDWQTVHQLISATMLTDAFRRSGF